VDTLEGSPWALEHRSPERFTMIVFYRGRHSPSCRAQLEKLASLTDRFAAMGIDLIAISGDSRERAEATRAEWEVEGLPLGYEIDEVTMRSWELFISRANTDEEPDTFCEPGVFIVDGEQKLFFCARTSMPFGRPDLEELAASLESAIEHDDPARGDA